MPEYNSLKEKLFKRQKGICLICSQVLKEDLEIHHLTKISLGGSKSKISNMVLLHKECHKTKHTTK